MILPGFSEVVVDGTRVLLGADRVYEWRDSLLPVSISAAGEVLSGPMTLALRQGTRTLSPSDVRVRITDRSRVGATVVADGRFGDHLTVTATTRVEYDGVAQIGIELRSVGPVTVDGLDLKVPVRRNDYTRMMAFDADTMIKRQKRVLFPNEYAGSFLNVLGFPDGERSFWLFADHAEGWIWNADTVTEVRERPRQLDVRQRLIGRSHRITGPMRFGINFLATPVKTLDRSFRTERVVRRVSAEEGRHGKYQIWWLTAFAHQNLPYTDYPPGTKSQLPAADLAVYKGPDDTRRELRRARSVGIERIPYFSTHALSGVDPALNQFRDEWAVRPPYVIPPGSDLPFTAKIARPWASHQADGFTDYLIYRFDALIDELGLQGLYFDQGGVIGSRHPDHGAWRDSNGRLQRATEIMALRDFYRRLATLFFLKGKTGAVFVHNSKTPVIPAFTFVHSMVQGEEFVIELDNLDYIDSIDLDATRSSFAGGQYGLVTTWLSELFSPRVRGGRPRAMAKKQWFSSPRYLSAYRNFMALALLHDVPTFSFAPLPERASIYTVLDRFETERATFSGYWNRRLTLDRADAAVSYYLHDNGRRALLVVANLSDTTGGAINVRGIREVLGVDSDAELRYRAARRLRFSPMSGDTVSATIPAKDFELIEVRVVE